MDVAGDFAVISIPFTLGTALSAFVLPESAFAYADAAILAAVSGAFIPVVRNRGCDRFSSAALFLILGIFCARTAALCGTPALPRIGGISYIRRTIASSEQFSDESKAILSAVLTGDRSLLGHDTLEAFRKSGASHILALSGLHLGIIFLIADKCLLFLGNSRLGSIVRSAACISICLWYTIATGSSPSITRAFLFICLNEVTKHTAGRKRNAANIFLFSMMVQLVINPYSITEISFQLSYLAVLGIIVLFPTLGRMYPVSFKWDPAGRIWSAVCLSVSCQAFTAPLAWYYFHSFPTHFLLTNLIALPLTWMLIVTGLAGIILSSFASCPPFLSDSVNFLSDALESSLEIIASM